jgi:hypothetical protein
MKKDDVMLDDDGYPTEDALAKIEFWPADEDIAELFSFMKSLWAPGGWYEDIGIPDTFNRTTNKYTLSTGGWSGNESLIRSLQANRMVWFQAWYSTTRGGKYVFLIPIHKIP